ncbi:hypothetical protein COV06_03495 [Candidatus Uhrbacteria bacterium CG10_big_fil_rev_8_21_14_0_10_50_16]|uniref:Uncharacterized protein n=1 Tax=Candidatus Uhrbacteria bacterium CG10_big_fil_rev_8_21_14_0_10_50_16 TaxID=1975039 RepID=A0A2H0RLW3_9BACT|nr:MAG: hypothetical protein COV06_03495 [Candidatus Uhrbacteria bacterium CG10_big_fil_rev_8_21_14_0_10_50_16]
MSEHSGRQITEAEIGHGIEAIKDQELISRYQPTYLGMGGEQVVFGIEGHPNSVIKVHKHTFGQVLNYNRTEGILDHVLSPEARSYLELRLARDRESQWLLAKHFSEHTLPERQYVQQLPVTRQLQTAIQDRWSTFDPLPDGVHQLWTTIRVQKRLPVEATKEGGAISLATPYLEESIFDDGLEEYRENISILLDGASLDDTGLLDECLPHTILDAMDGDPALRDILRDFTERAIQYTEDSGELLDIAGDWNVVVFKKENEKGEMVWDYLLPDVKYPARESVSRGRMGIETLLDGGASDPEQENTILNTVAYTRFVNALAIATGSDRRLKIADRPIAPKSNELLRVLKRELARWHEPVDSGEKEATSVDAS